jgi:hypothetical protein
MTPGEPARRRQQEARNNKDGRAPILHHGKTRPHVM